MYHKYNILIYNTVTVLVLNACLDALVKVVKVLLKLCLLFSGLVQLAR